VTIVLGRLNADMRAMYETVCRENRDIQRIHLTILDYVSQNELANMLHTVDICITRGSATTLAELDTYDILKVIIPLPYSG
jgi:UDP-N-acetylglucosamine:LPS N-acetylglucosamine transferase